MILKAIQKVASAELTQRATRKNGIHKDKHILIKAVFAETEALVASSNTFCMSASKKCGACQLSHVDTLPLPHRYY
jgi:hypothetical protein